MDTDGIVPHKRRKRNPNRPRKTDGIRRLYPDPAKRLWYMIVRECRYSHYVNSL